MPHGGKRAGSGRKPKIPAGQLPVVSTEGQTPLEFMLAVMRDPKADARTRLEAAKVAAPFMHSKAGETGKKGERKHAAEQVARGKFAPASAPKLVVNNG